MDLLISLFAAALIIYFKNNKKIGQTHVAHIICLMLVIFVGIRIVRKVCNLREDFDTEELNTEELNTEELSNKTKQKKYNCGKCQTSHDQKHDLYIPHRALVSKEVTDKERQHSRDNRLEIRNNIKEKNKENNIKINPKALVAMREHNSKGASRQLTTGLEGDGETNVNINVSYNISENILAEVQGLKKTVSAFIGKKQLGSDSRQDTQGEHTKHPEQQHHSEQQDQRDQDYLNDGVNTNMFKHLEATKNAHKLSAAETRKLIKGVKHSDADEKLRYQPGYSYVHPKDWLSTNKPPSKFKVNITNEGDKNNSKKVSPTSNGNFFELH